MQAIASSARNKQYDLYIDKFLCLQKNAVQLFGLSCRHFQKSKPSVIKQAVFHGCAYKLLCRTFAVIHLSISKYERFFIFFIKSFDI